MVEKIINQLADFSDQELNIIVEKAYAIREERRNAKIKELKKNFDEAWQELEKMGVCIYSNNDELLSLDDICFD